MKNSILQWLAISTCALFVSVMGEPLQPPSSDFLLDHMTIYATIIVGLFTLQFTIITLMGQPCYPSSGLLLWYGKIAGDGNSQHISDWYTFTHMFHGVLFYFITYGLRQLLPVVLTVNYCYVIVLSSAVIWEIFENSSFVIKKFRQTAASAAYNGDTVINSFSDSIACSIGFWVSHYSPWFVMLMYGLLEEIILGIVLRDNLIISAIQMIFPFKSISDWQARNTLLVRQTRRTN